MILHSRIDEVFWEMLYNSKTQQVNNWQGNADFKGTNMKVLREVTLKFNVHDKPKFAEDFTKPDIDWATEHFNERLSGKATNPGESYKNWPYHNDLDNSNYKEERFSHTYQERFWPKRAGEYFDKFPQSPSCNFGIRYNYGDLNDLIEQLVKDPSTRQAYIPIWFPEDTGANNRRVPCTLGYYFYIEDNTIHCIYTIRSCDIYRHFRNDVYFTIRLLQYIHETINKYNLNINIGSLRMDIYNLHLFINDAYALIKKENKLNNPKFKGVTVNDIWQKVKE